jgi:hypothetical protein
MPLPIRYPNSRFLQDWWNGSIKEQLSDCATQIAFFEGFAMRQYSSRELAERTNEILKELRSHVHFLEKSIQQGDYHDD